LLAQIFAFTPIAFLVLQSVVEGISPTLEEASQTLRASPHRTFFDITLPLAKPGLVSAFLISFVESLTDFGNPIILGGNTEVLATDIFFAIVGAQQNVGRAAALSAVLVALTLAAVYLQKVALGGASYATIGGKGGAGLHSPLPDGVRRFCVALAAIWCGLTLAVFLLVLIGGFVVNWGRDYTPSLVHYLDAFALAPGTDNLFSGTAWDSFLGTLELAVVVAPLSAGLGPLTMGGKSLTTFLRIELPLLRSALSGNLIYGFVRAVTTITAVIFLVSAGHELATTFIINRVINGDYGVAVAYSSVLIVTCLAVLFVIRRAVGTVQLGRRSDNYGATPIAIIGAG
jgi:iron(III) transport system permease protein